MLHTWVRLSTLLVLGTGSAMAYAAGNPTTSILLGCMALLSLWGYLRYAEVAAAWKAEGRGDDDRARRLVNRAHFGGRLLVRNHRASYHLLRGRLFLRDGDVDAALAEAARVLELGATPHNRAMAHAQRAACFLEREDADAAAAELAQARAAGPRASLSASLERIEKAIEDLRTG